MAFNLTDRVVLVSGASGNLGGAVARAFQATGAHLVLADRAANRLPDLFPDLVGSDYHMFCGEVDATDPASVQYEVERVVERFGRIDVLANTIGGYRAGTPTHETPIQTWEFLMGLNARTAFVVSRTVVPYMIRQGSGRIVHTAAQSALRGTTNHGVYAASKSAVVRIVESLSEELKDHGINVNCVLPGTIDTPQNREAMPRADYSRWVPPEAIADVFLFLASDAARAVTGAAIPVAGKG